MTRLSVPICAAVLLVLVCGGAASKHGRPHGTVSRVPIVEAARGAWRDLGGGVAASPPAASDAGEPVFHTSQPVSIYYSTGLVYHPATRGASAAAAAYFDPTVVQQVSMPRTGAVNLSGVFSPPNASGGEGMVQTAVVTARHIDVSDPGINTTHIGPIDTAVAVSNATAQVCTVYGMASAAVGPPKPSWTYQISNCLQGMGQDRVVAFSDDGRRVAIAARVAGAGPGGAPGIQLHVLDGQTGQRVCLYDVGVDATNVGPRAMSSMYSGARVAFVVGADIYVVNTTTAGGALSGGTTVSMGAAVGNFHMCPMGVFLVYGFVNSATVRMWNPQANAFQFKWSTTGPGNATHPWILESSMESVNGEDMNDSGCVVALGWMRGDGLQAAVTVHSMLTQKQFVTWMSPVSVKGQTPPLALAFDLGYLVVGTWGSATGNVPTVVVFSITSATASVPLLQYTTQGSVFAVDLVVDPYKMPPLSLPREGLGGGRQLAQGCDGGNVDVVYVSAVGKAVQANTRGDGGEAVMFRLEVPAAC